ncbi:MAG: nitronate monooxygenase [Tissierellia bacterium]|jgi:nitronate monooxygenase|nr:nitronate monooxygenase [Tissierellia bacterium]
MKPLKIGKFTMDIPIVQGGMGVGVSLGNLAGHVALEGGVGTISSVGIGFREPDYKKNNIEANMRALKKEIEKAKEISKGKGMIAVNIMQAITEFTELAKFAAENGADALVVGAGLPLKLPEIVAGTDVLIAPIVSSKRALDVIIRTWKKKFDRLPDFVILEGVKAGGHLGYSIEEIEGEDMIRENLKEILEYREEKGYDFPVIAAGGIFDGADVKEFLDLGANGVQLGTRFIATHECDASDIFKDHVVNATADDLKVIYSPVGMPGRAVNTPLLERVEREGRIKPKSCQNCLVPCDPGSTKYCISSALINSVTGNLEEGLVFSGVNVGKITKLQSVKEVIEDLTKELT